jgi:hypothetical protein
MRRILDAQRAWVDAGRVVAYRTALELDILKHHGDTARRDLASRWCTLVTPVLKSAWTDQAFHGASACLQVFGGHGYVREWGIEQIVRDARVAMIYEGTNEIQAIDLLLRKTLPDGGAALLQLLADIGAELGDDAAGPAREIRTRAASAPSCARAAAARHRQGRARRPAALAGRRLPARRGHAAHGLGLGAHRRCARCRRTALASGTSRLLALGLARVRNAAVDDAGHPRARLSQRRPWRTHGPGLTAFANPRAPAAAPGWRSRSTGPRPERGSGPARPGRSGGGPTGHPATCWAAAGRSTAGSWR